MCDDTPEFDRSGAEELSDGQEVFVIDINCFDIYEAVVYLKEGRVEVHYPEYPEDDCDIDLPTDINISKSTMNLFNLGAILAKQEIFR